MHNEKISHGEGTCTIGRLPISRATLAMRRARKAGDEFAIVELVDGAAPRSERARFWDDIVDAAVNGYAASGAFTVRYTQACGPADAWAIVRDDESEDREWFAITHETLKRGMGILSTESTSADHGVRTRLQRFYRDCDAGGFDAGDSCLLAELGVFGSAVYC